MIFGTDIAPPHGAECGSTLALYTVGGFYDADERPITCRCVGCGVARAEWWTTDAEVQTSNVQDLRRKHAALIAQGKAV